ncbi:MAG: NHLP bacteriocin system secretion protein [Hyphomicrobiaceae bacterium]|nr:NHLP bacteriocin system secretion protein [Hyphomicrobiaceae bacterium]
MTRTIFRQAALERLASPEQLDRPSQLVRPHGWLALAALLSAVVAAATWAVSATAPVKVSGAGILFDDGQLMEVVSGTGGRIVELKLPSGSPVAVGDVVAVLARPELELDLTKTRADLTDAKKRLAELQIFHAESDRRETEAEANRLDTIRTSQKHVTRREALLQEKMAGVERLLERKLLVRDRLIETELELASARERIAQLDDESRLIEQRRLERQSKARLALLDEELKVGEFERRLARLEAQLAEERSVRSPHAGRVAELKVSMGDVVTAGVPLATLKRSDDATTGLSALLYVPARDGRRIAAGMKVEVVPTTTLKEEFGFVSGVVSEVSDVAATKEGMTSALKNEQLVAKLSGEGAPIAVKVLLDEDSTTASGLNWSSSKGPAQRIPAGTLLDGAIVVERVAILTLLAPSLDRLLGMTER